MNAHKDKVVIALAKHIGGQSFRLLDIITYLQSLGIKPGKVREYVNYGVYTKGLFVYDTTQKVPRVKLAPKLKRSMEFELLPFQTVFTFNDNLYKKVGFTCAKEFNGDRVKILSTSALCTPLYKEATA